MGRDGRYDRPALCELSSLLTVKTLTGMTTDVYPRENCLDFVFVFFYPISEIGHCRHACRETPS
jgi:hypothetical protein